MTTDYDEIAEEALDHIREDGQVGTLVRSSGTYDPVTKALTGESELTGQVDYVEVPRLSGAVGQGYLNQYQEEITAGKVRFAIIAASGAPFEPLAGDLLRDSGSNDWELLGCNPLSPGGTDLIYKVGMRQK